MGNEEASGHVGGRLRALWGSRSRAERTTAVAAVGLAATIPFGGLSTAPDPPPGQIRAGETFSVGPFDVTVEKVVSVSDLEPVASPEQEGNRLLVVIAEIENVDQRPRPFSYLRNNLKASGAGVIERPASPPFESGTGDYVVINDGTTLGGEPNPGIAYRVAIVFEQRPGVGGPVALTTDRLTYSATSSLTLYADYWMDADEVDRRGTFPVEVQEP